MAAGAVPVGAKVISSVAIDAFDGVFETPPMPFGDYGPPGSPRQSLFANYGAVKRSRQDVRAHDRNANARRRNIYFTHNQVEKFQFLLLAKPPVFRDPFDDTGLDDASEAYLKSRTLAFQRYWQWQHAHNPGSAIEVVRHTHHPLEAPVLAMRTNPADPDDKRYRVNITPPGYEQLLYRGPASVRCHRYAYLPPGTRSNKIPAVFQGKPLSFVDILAQDQDKPKQLFAVGCSCLGYAFNGYDKGPGQGCKHMIFWNLCQTRQNETGVTHITWPATTR